MTVAVAVGETGASSERGHAPDDLSGHEHEEVRSQ